MVRWFALAAFLACTLTAVPDTDRVSTSHRPILFVNKGMELCLLDPHTRKVRVVPVPQKFQALYYSDMTRDGKTIVFQADVGNNQDLFVIHPDGSGFKRITDNDNYDGTPSLAPDRKHLAYGRGEGSGNRIWIMNIDGSEGRQLTDTTTYDGMPDWSPNGKRIAFVRDQELYAVDTDGGNVTRLTHSVGKCAHPAWSPNGRWIAFVSKEGSTDLYLMNADGSDTRRLIENVREDSIGWSPESRQILFVKDNRLCLVNVRTLELTYLTDGTYSPTDPNWN